MGQRIGRNLIAVFVGVMLFVVYYLVMVQFGRGLLELLIIYAAAGGLAYFFNRKSIWALRGNYLCMVGQQARARPLLKKAVEAGTKSPSAYIYYAIILIKQDENAKEAFRHLEHAKSIARNAVEERGVITAMATCHYMLNDAPAAIKVLEDMRNEHEYVNANALVMLGYLYLVTEEFDKAIEASELAIAEDTSFVAAYDNIGQVHFLQGDYAAAREAFEKALVARDTLADSNYYMGIICEAEGDERAAAEYFRKAAISPITHLNSITQEMADEKYNQYHS